MNKFRVLIVEDEIIIADTLERFLKEKNHEVVGSAISFEEAKTIYDKENPDIVLLDIRISGDKTGIDFAKYIQTHNNQPFIFLTSMMDANSINAAKETFPAGYLPKPVRKESLFSTIEIAMHSHIASQKQERTMTLHDGLKKVIIPLSDILYIQADHVYVKVFLKEEESILQRSTFKDFTEQLPKEHFFQTHRSFTINLKHVSHFDSQNVYVSGEAIPISRGRRKLLLSQLNVI